MASSMRYHFVLGWLLTLICDALGAPTFNPILPPSYPLAVKNPYLSGTIAQTPHISFY